jgi:hypothetical protein
MELPERITIALDEGTADLIKKLKDEMGLSQSELMREALKFFGKHKMLFESFDEKMIYTYTEMLSAGEHVIIDIDHWKLFLNFIETHPDKEEFCSLHKEICKAHAEQFRQKLLDAESILRRLEICNLFNIGRTGTREFALIFGSDITKKFVRVELEEIFSNMGFEVEIKDDFSKLRVNVIEDL